jgi:uncharacterized protein YbaA (DUF1428 family)
MAKGYVDGFVIAIPKKNKAKYIKMATEGRDIWKKFGALDYKECVIDDAKPKGVAVTFPKLVNLKAGETVWFSFITYKSKKHRDEVNKKVMAHFAKKYGDEEMASMPFAMDCFSVGGFNVEVTM